MVTTTSAMKKLLNRVEDIVPESLAGLAKAHPDVVKIDTANNVVLRAGGPRRGRVALVSGGGSGHEPLHGGFVGLGMLDAACAGNVFTSPVPDQMEAATRAVNGGAGVLHIVKNYTGDVLNFQMAAEIAGAAAEAGASLTDVTATAVKVNGQGRSMGLALTSCIVPAAGTPTFALGD